MSAPPSPIRSGQYKNPDDLIKALMALPSAHYITSAARSFDPSEGYEIDKNCAGITGAGSARPVMATKGLTACMGVAVYNPEQKIGGIAHLAQDPDDPYRLAKEGRKALRSLLAVARDDGAGKLEVRISGPMQGGGFADVFIRDALQILNDTPDLTFLSADFRGKDYPFVVGIDTRRWDEGLLKGRTTAISSPQDSNMAEIARRTIEGARDGVDMDSLPPAPSYNDDCLFDARALAKYSDRDKQPGKIER